MKKKIFIRVILFSIIGIILYFNAWGQNVIVIVIDGARYSETCEAGYLYMPHLWKEMRRHGTLWTNFRNDSLTVTNPGHLSIATGIWQAVDNKGLTRSAEPTIFEYFRKATGEPKTATAVVVGKPKLKVLAYSTNPD